MLVDESWTLSELVSEVGARIAALPAPANGQVRAVPDERTVRYYGTIGLLDRPVAMRGRTALYNRRHLAQVVAIKRLQTMGRSLAEIQTLWPTLDDHSLARMSGIGLGAATRAPARKDFWKREPASEPESVEIQPLPMPPPPPGSALPPAPGSSARSGRAASEERAIVIPQAGGGARGKRYGSHDGSAPLELRVELAPNVSLMIAMPDDIALSSADVRAIRAAAAPLVAELARCRLTQGGEEP
jgi:DNA-binding transcriptional MerR regulator